MHCFMATIAFGRKMTWHGAYGWQAHPGLPQLQITIGLPHVILAPRLLDNGAGHLQRQAVPSQMLVNTSPSFGQQI